MKSQRIKNKALELYLHNVPIYKIAKQLKINKTTFYKWKDSGKWEEIKEEAIHKANKKATEQLIEKQRILSERAKNLLAERLERRENTRRGLKMTHFFNYII